MRTFNYSSMKEQKRDSEIHLLGTIFAAYKDFDDRFSIVEEKMPVIDIVRKATINKIGKFTKQEIRELCLALSVSSIEGALRKLVKCFFR